MLKNYFQIIYFIYICLGRLSSILVLHTQGVAIGQIAC